MGPKEAFLMKTQDFVALEKKYLAPNYNPLDVVIESGEGVWVTDVEGKRYMDFLAAYSALNQGYCHPRIKKAMLEQVEKVTLTSRAFRNDKLPLLAEKLCNLLGYEMMLPMNSGAEAVETALKAARKWGYIHKKIPEGKANLIAMSNNFLLHRGRLPRRLRPVHRRLHRDPLRGHCCPRKGHHTQHRGRADGAHPG
jgi:ornithine--oxo-acid transaminase